MNVSFAFFPFKNLKIPVNSINIYLKKKTKSVWADEDVGTISH